MTERGYGVASWDQSKAAATDLLRKAQGPFVVWVVTSLHGDEVECEGIYALDLAAAEVARDDIGEQLAAFIDEEGGDR